MYCPGFYNQGLTRQLCRRIGFYQCFFAWMADVYEVEDFSCARLLLEVPIDLERIFQVVDFTEVTGSA